MKLLAILKDSLREALDWKVFYVMVALSCVVVLFFFCFSFEPVSAEEGVAGILDRFPGGRPGLGNPFAPFRYEVQRFTQLNEGARPWNGEYEFDFVVHRREMPPEYETLFKEAGVDVFRLFVWMYTLQVKEEDKLSEEDRKARERVIKIWREAQTLPPEEAEKLLNQGVKEEVDRLTPAQMESFVADQLGQHGALEATSVELKPAKEEAAKFTVRAKAKPETYRTWPTKLHLFFGAVTWPGEFRSGAVVYNIEDVVVGTIGASVAMLVATIVTAFFIPGMLQKGSLDLLLAKPIHRSVLLVYKYLGGLTFMFLNTLVIVVGIWLVMGIRSGLWAPAFLLSIFFLTFQFAIFYAISTLFGVLTRNSIVAIFMTCLAWAVFFVVGYAHFTLSELKRLEMVPIPGWVYTTSETVHYVLPRYKDVDVLSASLLAEQLLNPESNEYKQSQRGLDYTGWPETFLVSALWIALLLGLACWRFATKDY